jgi:hypothetical protein
VLESTCLVSTIAVINGPLDERGCVTRDRLVLVWWKGGIGLIVVIHIQMTAHASEQTWVQKKWVPGPLLDSIVVSIPLVVMSLTIGSLPSSLRRRPSRRSSGP